jgi:hypothetical protein
MKFSTKFNLQVGQFISLEGFPEGQIISAEKCSLQSFIKGPRSHWTCWTVKTKATSPLHKYLITGWGSDGVIVWSQSKLETAPSKARLWLERSGHEEMRSIKNLKSKIYLYSMLVYIIAHKSEKPKKFFAIERLKNGGLYKYDGLRID